MSSSLGNGYIGADVNFINDATQEALDLKSNLAGGNTFTGDQNLSNGNIVLANGSKLQGNEIVGNNELYMRTIGNANIRLEPDGTGEITGTKDINLSAGKAYKVNGVNILNNIPTNSNVVLLTGDQDVNGIKTFKSDVKADSDLLVNTDAGLIKFGSAGDRQLARTISGISTNGTMNATQYNVNNAQISSSNLSNDTFLVKTTGNQTLTGKTISADDNTIENLRNAEIASNAGIVYSKLNIADGDLTIAKTDTLQGALDGKASDTAVVKLSGDQDVNGIKSFKDNVKVDTDLLVNTDAGLIKFGSAGDRELARTADGISTNGTMNATQYNVNNVQISSSNLSNNTELVKTTGNQTLSGKTIDANANTIQNLTNGEIASNAGIVYSKLNIADGDLTIAKTDTLQGALDGKASDTAVVKLTGNQDINDIKTFKSDVKVDTNLLINTDNGLIKFGSAGDFQFARIADGISTNGKINAVQYKVGGNPLTSSHLLDGATLVKESGIQTLTLKTIDADDNTIQNLRNAEIASNAGIVYSKLNIADGDLTIAKTDTLQSALDAKANLTANTFTERQTITKAHNYSQLHLIDSSTAGAGKGGGIEFLGVFNGSGATTAFATIKSQKANATIGNYEANLSLQVRQHGGGGYTEVVGLKGADLSAHFSGAVNISGALNLNPSGIPEGTGATKETEPAGLSVGDVWRAGNNSSQTLKIKSS